MTRTQEIYVDADWLTDTVAEVAQIVLRAPTRKSVLRWVRQQWPDMTVREFTDEVAEKSDGYPVWAAWDKSGNFRRQFLQLFGMRLHDDNEPPLAVYWALDESEAFRRVDIGLDGDLLIVYASAPAKEFVVYASGGDAWVCADIAGYVAALIEHNLPSRLLIERVRGAVDALADVNGFAYAEASGKSWGPRLAPVVWFPTVGVQLLRNEKDSPCGSLEDSARAVAGGDAKTVDVMALNGTTWTVRQVKAKN